MMLINYRIFKFKNKLAMLIKTGNVHKNIGC